MYYYYFKDKHLAYCDGGLGIVSANCSAPSTPLTQPIFLEVNISAVGASFASASSSRMPALMITISGSAEGLVHIGQPQVPQNCLQTGLPLPPIFSYTLGSPSMTLKSDLDQMKLVL